MSYCKFLFSIKFLHVPCRSFFNYDNRFTLMKLVFVESREIYTHALAVPVSAEELHFNFVI